MDNHIFRSAIGGFNRQDVIEYIERTQKQSEESVSWLESQVEQLQKSENEAQMALQDCMAERDQLAKQLEEMTARYSTAKNNWESQAQAKESSRRDVAQRDKTIREMTEENQRLFHRVQELEGHMDDLRRSKEQLAQLELDARKRSDQVIAEAEAEAGKVTAAAEAEAKKIVSRAQETYKGIIRRTKICVEDTAEDFNEILQTFQSVTDRITGELSRLDDTVTEFPVGLNALKKDLDELLYQINERDAETQKASAPEAGGTP